MSLTGKGSRGRRIAAAALASAISIAVALPPMAVAQDLSGDIRFTWWGATSRNQKTEGIADLFEKANPGVTITREPGEFGLCEVLLASFIANERADFCGGRYRHGCLQCMRTHELWRMRRRFMRTHI